MKTSRVSLSTNEKIGLISNLATMLAAGIPILESISSLLEGSKTGQKKILETLLADLKQGQPINQSIAKFPKTFDKVTVNLVKAAEEAGTLDTTLKDLAINIRKESEFADKVKSALMYPMFILGVFFAVLILMLTFVIPRISQVFSQLRVTLPLPTRVLIFASNLLMNNTLIVITIALAIAILLVFLIKTQRGIILGVLFAFPVVSGLMRKIDITRFSRSLYLLLSSGVPITSSLELCQDVVMKKEVHNAILYATKQVSSGHPLSEALKKYNKIFPTIMIKILEAGEKTGSLDTSMSDTADYLDYEVSKQLKQVTAMMEPLMLVMIGVLVGGMMLAIIAPMYGLISQISNTH